MGKIIHENKKLEAQKDMLIECSEKLKLAKTKNKELQRELLEKKELLSASEKKRMELLLQKNEIEDRESTLLNRLKQTELRF
jgi:hypothetical protein